MANNKRLVYISMYNFDKNNGVVKKIINQVKTFAANGFAVECFYARGRRFYVHTEAEILLGESKGIKSIDFCKYMKKYLASHSYDCAYARHTGRIDPWILGVLRKLHRRGVKVLYEFPTFPYEKISFGKRGNMDWVMDHFFRRYLRRYVDRTVTMSEDEVIYGIPNIIILNGICVEDVKPIQKTEDNGVIDLIAVAAFFPYSGYDKIIEAMGRYYREGGRENVKLHLVGEGAVLEEYRELIARYCLEDRVISYGFQTGAALDQIYEDADIALGTMAVYRINLKSMSSLKVREYLAKGLPIITGCKEDAFDKKEKYEFYYMYFKGDSTPIDLQTIIRFYKEIYEGELTRRQIHERIRSYAKKKIDMSVTMQPVIDYMNA